MSMVLDLTKNKRDEYKRQLDAEFQDQQRKHELKRDVDRNKLTYMQQIQQLIAQNQAMAQLCTVVPAAALAPVAAIPAPQSTRLPLRQIKHFKEDILEWT
ncbi:hypothetical protein OUZ56_021682 [Daphnia magna]|uniref:Uncharacterized protein n=1 Tax=Daphnia magna TaxID=35525 RepID=A0ABR0AU82_9CRUS|nr:hypothetical protein OUZ56_021682 [Daphnia magna]